MTSSPHDPYGLGYTRVTMVSTKSSYGASRRESHKSHPSTDCSLQFENMKQESLVIVDQHATVNLYLSLVLPARHTLEIPCIGSLRPPGGARGPQTGATRTPPDTEPRMCGVTGVKS